MMSPTIIGILLSIGFVTVTGQNSSDLPGSSFSHGQLNITQSSYFLGNDGTSESALPANEYSSTTLLFSGTATTTMSALAPTTTDVGITRGDRTVVPESVKSETSSVFPSESLAISESISSLYLTANSTMSSDVYETTEMNEMSQTPFVTSQPSQALNNSARTIQSSVVSLSFAVTQSYVESTMSTNLNASFSTTVVPDGMKTPFSESELSTQYATHLSVISNESTHIPIYLSSTPLSYANSFTLSSFKPYSSSTAFLSSVVDLTLTSNYTTLGFLTNDTSFAPESLTSSPIRSESELESESELKTATSRSEASSEAFFTLTSSDGFPSYISQELTSSKGVNDMNSTASSELVSNQANVSSMESPFGISSSSSDEYLSVNVSPVSDTRLSSVTNFSSSFFVSVTSTIKVDSDFESLSSIISPISSVESTLIMIISSLVTELSPSYSMGFAYGMSSAVNETFIDRSSFSSVSPGLSELVSPSIASDMLTLAVTSNKSFSVQSSSSVLFPSPGYILSSTASDTSVFITATPHLVSVTSNIETASIMETVSLSSTHSLLVTATETRGGSKTNAIISPEMTQTIYSLPVQGSSYLITPSPVLKVYSSTSSVTPSSEIMPDLKLIFEFEGDCDRLILNAKLQIEFWQALIAVLSIETSVHIPREHVQPEDLTCHPFQVILLLKHLNRHDYTKIVEKNISISNLGVPILDDMSVMEFEIKSVKVISMETGYIKRPSAAKPVLEKEDIIIIVTAGVLFGFLLSVCAAIACRECYKRRRAASFNLLDVPHVNLDMEDFTLTKIPRPQMIYRENNATAPTSSAVKANRQGRPKSLPASDSNAAVTNGKHSINADSIQVRIQPHPDGVVVGVTCTPPRSPTKESVSEHSSPRSDASDPSVQTLIKDKSSEFGMANPNFEADDEVKSADNKKYIIREDEEEALL